MSSILSDTVVKLEHETWRAMQRNGAALIPYLSPKCIMLFPMGLKVSASTSPSLDDVLKSDAFVPWKSYSMKNVEVLEIGHQGAIVCYEVAAVRPPLRADGKDETFKALISSTWKLDEETGKWTLLLHQQTPFDLNLAEDDVLG